MHLPVQELFLNYVKTVEYKSCIICIKRCNFQNNVLDIILLWFSLLISLPVTLLKKILVSDYDFL